MSRAWFWLWLALCCGSTHAHKPSDAYLALSVQGAEITAEWQIHLRDLDLVLGLDNNGDGRITWGELQARQPDIADYALGRLQLAAGDLPCPANSPVLLVDQRSDGGYAVLRFNALCPRRVETLQVDYRLLFDLDPQHKGLLKLIHPTGITTHVFSAAQPRQPLSLAQPSTWHTLVEYIGEGIWHIGTGYDHLLFLLSLLLPVVLLRTAGGWQGATAWRPVLRDAVTIVTAFTVAHSLTLTLAALGTLSLPSRWVESAIAASVILAALNNLYPLLGERRWLAAFGFGLIHGFGFAGALAEIGLPQSQFLLGLAAFNIGVELGQLSITLALLPVAWWLRHSHWYRRGVLVPGSFAISVLAAVWLVERAFDVALW